MIGCTENYIGSELMINYKHICFSRHTNMGGIVVKQNMYGTAYVNETVEIVWRKRGEYEIVTGILPIITCPYNNPCKRTDLQYHITDDLHLITLTNKESQYVFRRKMNFEKKEDGLIKLFLTQLLFDLIIRHIGT